ITYSFELAADYLFENPIIKEENVVIPVMQLPQLAPGQYFIRVLATNKSGLSQCAFDYYNIASGKVYGVKCFYVAADGSIVEDV
ncbi:CotH kinase family protein, partial [Streptococcus pyogenes]